jgi:hypothetical protein
MSGLDGLKEGVGGEALQAGLGCCNPGCEDVKAMLALGSPRLALAKALGVPLAPWAIRIAATFSTVGQANSMDNGQDVKLVQDVIIDDIRYQIDNQNTPNGDFDAFNNAMFAKQSNIEATLKVSGAPRYEVYPNFTPLAMIKRPTCGWILQNTQGLLMSFQSNVSLPFAPIKITFVFEGRTTHWAKLIEMKGRDALVGLQKLGYDVGTYIDLYC